MNHLEILTPRRSLILLTVIIIIPYKCRRPRMNFRELVREIFVIKGLLLQISKLFHTHKNSTECVTAV